LPLKSSNKGWHHKWFYMDSHEPRVPSDVDYRPVAGKHWDDNPNKMAMSQGRNYCCSSVIYG
jgi:hypothetical protein